MKTRRGGIEKEESTELDGIDKSVHSQVRSDVFFRDAYADPVSFHGELALVSDQAVFGADVAPDADLFLSQHDEDPDQVGRGDKEDHRMKDRDPDGGDHKIANTEAEGTGSDAESDSVPDREGIVGSLAEISQGDAEFFTDLFHWKCLLKM